MTSTFEADVANRTISVAIVGLGYVGLPLAISFAEAGFNTLGFDINSDVVAQLQTSQSHIADISHERLKDVTNSRRFKATDKVEDLANCNAIFICVPTPFDKAQTPDLSYIESAARLVRSILQKDMLIILQSTTYPGTTTEFVKPILEASGLNAGTDFFLAFSPERVDPGNEIWNVRNTPKVVGGFSENCTKRSTHLLSALMGSSELVHTVSSPEIAEMTKLLENTYRAVNIALVNELAQLCHRMEIDVWDVIEAAATKPFGFQAFYPGIGAGGHCIPVDPHYLAWKAREYEFQLRFVELAADVNMQMATYVVDRIGKLLNKKSLPVKGSKILCIGASFKPGVSDTRNSRALKIIELLIAEGAEVSYFDQNVPSIKLEASTLVSKNMADVVSAEWDMVAVLVNTPNVSLSKLDELGVTVFDAVNESGEDGEFRRRL